MMVTTNRTLQPGQVLQTGGRRWCAFSWRWSSRPGWAGSSQTAPVSGPLHNWFTFDGTVEFKKIISEREVLFIKTPIFTFNLLFVYKMQNY